MVTNVTSLTGNGLKDWLIQRVTAVYFAAYVLYLAGFFLLHPHVDFSTWQALFSCKLFKTATILALLTLSLHSWIGVWTVTTDYMKGTALRICTQMLVLAWLLSQFIWGLMIVWGQ